MEQEKRSAEETDAPPTSEPRKPRQSINDESLLRAMQFLAFALEMASGYDVTQPDHGRSSVRTALVGVIRLVSELFPNVPSLPIALNDLLYGLWDLDRGQVVPLLKPIKLHHRAPNPLSDDLFRAIAAAALTRLMEGRRTKQSEAAAAIARKLTRMGYRHSSRQTYTRSQIEDWRNKMMTERAAENLAVARYQLALKSVQAMEPSQAADWLLQLLPGLHPPNFPKKPPS